MIKTLYQFMWNANEQWGLQLGRVFKGQEAGKQYAYRIDYTIDGAAAKWIGVATADEKGEVCSGQVKLLHLGRTYFCLCLASNGVSPPLYECGLTWLYHKNT